MEATVIQSKKTPNYGCFFHTFFCSTRGFFDTVTS